MNESEDERKELPLSVLKLSFEPYTVLAPAFMDIHNVAVCAYTSRFSTLANIERHLEESHLLGYEVYLYKLYEQMISYGKPEKELTYILRYLVQAKRRPDGSYVTEPPKVDSAP